MSRESRLERFARLPVLEPKRQIMPERQARLWPALGVVPDDFVLYGGTGLALRLGHRVSVDFGFFSSVPFAPTELLERLTPLGRMTVNRAAPNSLDVTTPDDVHLSFFGRMQIQSVAEPAMAPENGLVVASIFDLAGTKTKAILDRSEWKDYFDVAFLLRAGQTLDEIAGYARTIFSPLFEFPVAVFLRALVDFEEGTADQVSADVRRELERAVVRASALSIPIVEPYSATILPWNATQRDGDER